MEPCRFEDKINETHKILTGNGNPENGICRQVALINERQQGVLTELKEIKENHNVLLKEMIISGTKIANIEGKIMGKETAIKSMVKNGLIIIGFIITIGLALWTRSSSQSNGKGIKAVQENQDTMKLDMKKSITRGIVILPIPEKFDIKKHGTIVDSLINAMNK